jgi:hypothetical protein
MKLSVRSFAFLVGTPLLGTACGGGGDIYTETDLTISATFESAPEDAAIHFETALLSESGDRLGPDDDGRVTGGPAGAPFDFAFESASRRWLGDATGYADGFEITGLSDELEVSNTLITPPWPAPRLFDDIQVNNLMLLKWTRGPYQIGRVFVQNLDTGAMVFEGFPQNQYPDDGSFQIPWYTFSEPGRYEITLSLEFWWYRGGNAVHLKTLLKTERDVTPDTPH